jgi:thiamine transport system substrate-binding protein
VNRLTPLLLALVLLPLGGCSSPPAAPAASPTATASAQPSYAGLGFDGHDTAGTDPAAWPDLTSQTVTILDQGAFEWVFAAAKPLFENLTHARVEHVAALDAGDTLQRAIREKGDPSFDVIYGLDNVLVGKAEREGVLAPYQPLLSPRIDATLPLADAPRPWSATPVDHGFIAVNVAPRQAANVTTLQGLVAHAGQFVTEDPRTSSPGLGFLVATVATFGDKGSSSYDFTTYWDDLFTHGALVTPGWTEAYVQHFSAGYGAGSGGAADKDIVTSYTTSPAYEAYSGANHTAAVLAAPKSTFHQVETMAIAKGARHPVAAQAWIEFTLTDAYQSLMAPQNAVYPVVPAVDVAPVYAHADPDPAHLQDAGFSAAALDANAERWVQEWTEVYERHH